MFKRILLRENIQDIFLWKWKLFPKKKSQSIVSFRYSTYLIVLARPTQRDGWEVTSLNSEFFMHSIHYCVYDEPGAGGGCN